MVVVLAAGLALSGCAGEAQIRTLEHDGQIRIDKSQRPDADYIVSVKNYADLGYEPDDKPTRDDVVLRYVAAQCPKGRIVGEDVIETGKNLLGRQMRTYQVKVKC